MSGSERHACSYEVRSEGEIEGVCDEEGWWWWVLDDVLQMQPIGENGEIEGEDWGMRSGGDLQCFGLGLNQWSTVCGVELCLIVMVEGV
ncbi:hypothetical protein Hanom_Chr09g00864601 [Helianthus anomalus]